MKDIIPDFLTFIFPLIDGIVLLLSNFSWLIVGLLAILVILGFGGNAVVRGSFACKCCKQRRLVVLQKSYLAKRKVKKESENSVIIQLRQVGALAK